MSESLKNSNKENPDAKKWESIDSETSIQQKTDFMDNKILDKDLKDNSKEREQRLAEQVFLAKTEVIQSYKRGTKKGEFGLEQERFEERQAAKENREKYGENLNSEAAKRCFSREFVTLKSRFEKVKRAEEKERKMSSKDRQKSYKKRLKEGIVMSSEDRKHLLEMDRMDEYEREEYGRKKRQAYMNIQGKKDAHPIKFRYLVRKHQLSIPKERNDPNYSLSDLQLIDFNLISLDDKNKK